MITIFFGGRPLKYPGQNPDAVNKIRDEGSFPHPPMKSFRFYDVDEDENETRFS